MKNYRKKPEVIQAMEWDGTATGAQPIIEWAASNGATIRYRNDPIDARLGDNRQADVFLSVKTLEGIIIQGRKGDFVVLDPQGGFHPVKPALFALNYEGV